MLGATVACASIVLSTSPSFAAPRPATATHPSVAAYPLGVPDRREPSGLAPPRGNAMPGYLLVYKDDFSGRALPTAWGKFNGVPSGDAGSQWAPSHVLTGGGIIRLVTYRDPRFHRNWVSGGMCQCTVGRTYGAFFVRSRVTGPGPDEAELLWPVAHVWPPEIDMNESAYSTTKTSWTVHYGTGNTFVQGTHTFSLTSWHTWGVIWTPKSLTFTMDGRVWGRITRVGQIPHQAMTLDIDQQTRCNAPASWAACPKHKAALQIDWVAEFAPR